MARFGPTELIIVLVIVILVFGVGRLGQIGKELGMGETTAFECHARAMRRLRKLFGSDGD